MKPLYLSFLALIGIVAVVTCCCWENRASSQETILKEPKKTESSFVLNDPSNLIEVFWHDSKGEKELQSTFSSVEKIEVDVGILADIDESNSLDIVPLFGAISDRQALELNLSPLRRFNGAKKPYEKSVHTYENAAALYLWGESDYSAISSTILDGTFARDSKPAFVSSQRSYPWKKGLYTLEIVAMNREQRKDKAVSRWVGMFVFDHHENTRIYIGSVRTAGETMTLARQILSSSLRLQDFLEDTSKVRIAPNFQIAIGNIRLDGQPFEPTAITTAFSGPFQSMMSVQMVQDHLKDHPEHMPFVPPSDYAVVLGFLRPLTTAVIEQHDRPLFQSAKQKDQPLWTGEKITKVFPKTFGTFLNHPKSK